MITREEQYLNRLAGETEQAIPEPETRKEQYLSRLCGADNIIPEKPITREEQYLASLCGEEVEMPEPETRLEQYMAFAGGERENKPEPITRKEQLWDKYQGGGVIEDKTVTGEIISVSDAVEAPAVKLKVSIEPKQDLHGYDHPWPAGGGKNKLKNNMTSATKNGITFIVNDDGTVKVSGTATTETSRLSNFQLKAGSYIYNTSVSETFQTFDSYLSLSGTTIARGMDNFSSFTLAEDSTILLIIRVRNDQSPNVTFKPMIRLSTETDSTFEPYSNICPITGWTGAEANVNDEARTTPFGRTVYGGTVDLITGELVVDKKCYIVTGSEPTPTEQGSILIGSRNNRLRIRKLDDCEAGLITSGHISNIGVNSDVRSAQQNSWKLGDFMYDNQYVFVIIPSEYTTFETGLAYVASLGAIYEYPLAEPQTYTLTPQQIQMLEGNNTVWVELINEGTTTQTATSELTYKSRAAQRVLAMNSKLSLNKQALEIKRNGGAIIDKPIIKPIGGGAKL